MKLGCGELFQDGFQRKKVVNARLWLNEGVAGLDEEERQEVTANKGEWTAHLEDQDRRKIPEGVPLGEENLDLV